MKVIKWFLLISGAVLVLGFLALQGVKLWTKRASPETVHSYAGPGLKITITYCAPFKNGRTIFGGLVPYGATWRTGANEPSTFTTDRDLDVAGKPLRAGTYTLWTVPHEQDWDVVFNRKMYTWGIQAEGEASRDPAEDALVVNVPVQALTDTVEQFRIRMVKTDVLYLEMAWDRTQVAVPIQ
jgi:hypothetical protein